MATCEEVNWERDASSTYTWEANRIFTMMILMPFMRSWIHNISTQIVKNRRDIMLSKYCSLLTTSDPTCTRPYNILHMLYIRGRHDYLNTFIAIQKLNDLHASIMLNWTEIFVYKLRNMKDLETFIDAASAVWAKQTFLEMYHTTTAEPYSFLYVKLTAKNHENMFSKISIKDSS